jgi:phosphoglycolate phosphatase
VKRYYVSIVGLKVEEMKYNTMIFDFDYTLADATNGIVSSFNHAFSKLNLPGPTAKA